MKQHQLKKHPIAAALEMICPGDCLKAIDYLPLFVPRQGCVYHFEENK